MATHFCPTSECAASHALAARRRQYPEGDTVPFLVPYVGRHRKSEDGDQ